MADADRVCCVHRGRVRGGVWLVSSVAAVTTVWWLIVVWGAVVFAFVFGYVVRRGFEQAGRQVYDVDFTRKRIGTR